MAIEIKFKVEGQDDLYDDPIDAMMEAAYISQNQGGTDVKVFRGVKYTRSQDFKWTSVTKINLPSDVTEKGPVAVRDNDFVNKGWKK